MNLMKIIMRKGTMCQRKKDIMKLIQKSMLILIGAGLVNNIRMNSKACTGW